MTLITSDQGITFPAGTDVNDGVAAFASELGANPTTGASGTGGTESRLVKRYLSATDRSARNPSPAAGEMSYRADIADYEAFVAGTWRKPWWNTGWGVIGGSIFKSGANWTTIGTGEGVWTSAGGNFQTPSLNLNAGRRYRIRAKIIGVLGSTTASIVARIRETNVSGAIVAEYVQPIDAVNGKSFILEGTLETSTAVTKVYCVSGSTTTGTATVNAGSVANPSWLEVEDIGPAGILVTQSYP